MENLQSTFLELGDAFVSRLPGIIAALIVFLFFVFIGYAVNRIIKGRIIKRLKAKIVASFVAEIIKWVFISIGFLIALHMMGFGGIASSLLAGAGVSAIILGFAFKDIAENFLAGMILAINRPFKAGDIIQVDSFKGPVVDIDMRTTHIRSADGRDIYIPNSIVIKSVFTNYTKDGFLRLEFMVGLDQNDDLEKARVLILNHLKSQNRILKDPESNVIVEELGVNTVDMKVFFWIDLYGNSSEDPGLLGEPVRSQIMREVKDMLLNNGFNLPSNIVEHKMYKPESPVEVKVAS